MAEIAFFIVFTPIPFLLVWVSYEVSAYLWVLVTALLFEFTISRQEEFAVYLAVALLVSLF